METKPFSLQSPERIAKEYAGNKQKIGQAAQMGLLDPTAALLAGMFIDRMRSAAIQEQAPQQTVAQQVFAPPAPRPQMGLGAIAPQGAPQMPPAPMAPPPQQAPVGMASGGAVGEGAYAGGGGLTLLDLPDSMFDEPNSGGYAGGGIVAFADGGLNDRYAPAQQLAGLSPYIDFMGRMYGGLGGPGTAMAEQEAALRETRSPEALAKRKKEDMWMALAQIGANMAASKSPYFLQSAGEAMREALPGVAAAAKDRRQEQREALKQAVDMEIAKFGLKTKSVESAINLKNNADQLAEKGLDRDQALKIAAEDNATRIQTAKIGAGAQTEAARISAKSYTDFAKNELIKSRIAARRASAEQAEKAVAQRYPELVLQLSNERDPAKLAQARTKYRSLVEADQAAIYSNMTGELMPKAPETSFDKNGNPIVKINGRWVYP